MDIGGIALGVVIFMDLILGYITLKANIKDRNNRLFALFSVFMALWATSLFFFDRPIIFPAHVWLRICYVIVLIIVSLILYQSYIFPFPSKRSPRIPLVVNIILSIPFLYFIIFTDLFVVGAETFEWGSLAKTGPVYMAFGPICSVWSIISLWNYIEKIKIAKGRAKIQLVYFFVGLISMIIPILILDVLLPLAFNNPRYFGLSPISTFLFLGPICYAIVLHRLLGVRFIIGRFLYHFASAIAGFGVFYFVAFIFTKLWGNIFSTGAIISTLFISFFSVPLFLELIRFIQRTSEKQVIYTTYDPYEILNNLLKIVSTELNVDKVVANVLAILKQAFEVQKSGLVIFDKESRKVLYKRLSNFDKNGHRHIRDLLEVVNFWDFQEAGGQEAETLVYEEILAQPKERSEEESRRLIKILNFMKEEKVSVLLPLNRKVQLNGLMLVGNKEDEEAYTVGDIDLLESVVANASVAVGRALLYREVQDFAGRLEDKVDQATKELQEKVEALGTLRRRERDLLDILGHELRTPLSIVKNAIGLMRLKKRKGILTDEDIDKNLDAADESLGREIKIVETILGATKLEANKLELHLEEVDIIDVVNDGMAAHKKKVEKKDLKVDFKSARTTFPPVYADRTRIQEVFDNILSNAVKYTEQGEITISLKEEEDFVYVAVKDTGVGIPKKDIESLGKKFYRVKQYLRKGGKMRMVRPGGSGLGLYVTFGYTRAMGGDVKVKSEVGKGSTFTFSVPKYRGQKHTKDGKQEKDVFKRMGLK